MKSNEQDVAHQRAICFSISLQLLSSRARGRTFDVRQKKMPNPPSNPSILRVFLDGGSLMAPFVLILILWLVFTLRYATKTRDQRTSKWRAGLLLFPITFGLLAVSQWVLHWHAIYKGMEISGFPDEWQHIQDVLVVTRSTLMIVVAACISLLTTTGMFALPSQEK